MEARSFGNPGTESRTYIPHLMGRSGAVATEHYLSCLAARDVLRAGGNAVDAAVAATLVEGVVNPHMHTIGGECPMLIKMVSERNVICLNGNTAAPALSNPTAYRQRGLSVVPEEGVLAAGVPAAMHALISALDRFGRLPFAEVVGPALTLARDGFPAHEGLIGQKRFGITDLADKFLSSWSGSAAIYLPDGRIPKVGQYLTNSPLASLLDFLANAERSAKGSRMEKLGAVLHAFYRGDVASTIHRFVAEHDGFLVRGDLEKFRTLFEIPARRDFANYTVFKCGFWNQGPAMLQTLAILEHFDLRAKGHNSPDYLHLVIEAIKLAFADREQYYADPEQVDVPADALLSDEYAELRAALIDVDRANGEIRPGDPVAMNAELALDRRLGGTAWGTGTVHVDVIDGEGNMAAFTPSGAWIMSSQVMPTLGFPLGNRLMTFYLEPNHHPNVIAPNKRPRTTISPSLLYRDGRPWMVFGSMGGDRQDQWMVQFFLNHAIFGMGIQEAIEAPKLSSEHFPGFFAPHNFYRNRVLAEPRIGRATLGELARRGHAIVEVPDWTEGYLLAATRDPQTGVLEAAFDPRGGKTPVFPAYALCW